MFRPNRTHLAVISIALVIFFIALALGTGLVGNTGNKDEAIVTFSLPGGDVSINCMVADNSTERQQGLMNVESMGEDSGMLFVFESAHTVSFWMKDTLIPLDIIFVNQTGHIVNIEQADPEPGVPDSMLTRYDSQGPVLWVVEVNQGTCSREGIVPGTQMTIEYLN